MTVDARRGGNTRWFREPYAWLVFAIPALSVVSGIAMLFLSQVNNDGMVVDDYYRRGLAIDRDLDRDLRAAELGLRAQFQLAAVGNSSVTLHTGSWRPADQLQLKLVHPTRPGLDEELTLVRSGAGGARHSGSVAVDYVGPGMVLAEGAWHLELAAAGWRLRGRLRVPGDGTVLLEPPSD